MNTHCFNKFAVVQKRRLVLNVITRHPRLDLIPHTLQLLNLRLEVRLQLFLLRLIRRRLHLVVYALEELDALRNLLQCPVDLGCVYAMGY